jgi:hypothetical protein
LTIRYGGREKSLSKRRVQETPSGNEKVIQGRAAKDKRTKALRA